LFPLQQKHEDQLIKIFGPMNNVSGTSIKNTIARTILKSSPDIEYSTYIYDQQQPKLFTGNGLAAVIPISTINQLMNTTTPNVTMIDTATNTVNGTTTGTNTGTVTDQLLRCIHRLSHIHMKSNPSIGSSIIKKFEHEDALIRSMNNIQSSTSSFLDKLHPKRIVNKPIINETFIDIGNAIANLITNDPTCHENYNENLMPIPTHQKKIYPTLLCTTANYTSKLYYEQTATIIKQPIIVKTVNKQLFNTNTVTNTDTTTVTNTVTDTATVNIYDVNSVDNMYILIKYDSAVRHGIFGFEKNSPLQLDKDNTVIIDESL
jgi:hypothetical protein